MLAHREPQQLFMSSISITNIKNQVLSHPRIVSHLPPHFETTRLDVRHLNVHLDGDKVKQLIKLALSRVSGRIFIDLNSDNNILTVGFEDPQELAFFLLLLPDEWRKN